MLLGELFARGFANRLREDFRVHVLLDDGLSLRAVTIVSRRDSAWEKENGNKPGRQLSNRRWSSFRQHSWEVLRRTHGSWAIVAVQEGILISRRDLLDEQRQRSGTHPFLNDLAIVENAIELVVLVHGAYVVDTGTPEPTTESLGRTVRGFIVLLSGEREVASVRFLLLARDFDGLLVRSSPG